MHSLFSTLIRNYIPLSWDPPELHRKTPPVTLFNLTEPALPKVLIFDSCPSSRFPAIP
jgi:hypothetical protein